MVGDCLADSADLTFANQNETIHNRPDLSHEPLNEGICLGRSGRGEHGFYALVAQNMLEGLRAPSRTSPFLWEVFRPELRISKSMELPISASEAKQRHI